MDDADVGGYGYVHRCRSMKMTDPAFRHYLLVPST